MELPMGILFLALLGLSTALVCPDGGMCEDKNTCCKNTMGGYGCCPLPHAECCSDHLHCCYERTLCDLAHRKCVNKTVSLPWMRRLPAKQALEVPQLFDRVKTIVCPDQVSTCSNDSTCCQLLDGSWACCPMVKAVCCEDKQHCCPEGTKCDTAHEVCVSASLESVPMVEKLPAKRRENYPVSAALTVGSVTCPGGKSSCPDGYTCCLLTTGDYGCCPYDQAVCCSDHVHCCPSNTICDMEHDVCKSGETEMPLLKKISAVLNDIVCPDKVAVCPDQTTCCEMDSGSYGCCPMPNAVCCSDHIHCCPEETTCDLQHSTCVSTRGDAIMASKIPAAVTELVAARSRVAAVPCNDSVACADENTCCQTPSGQWACCPLPKAVCCEDHMHCCPHGTVCNLEASTCDDPTANTAVMPWLHHVPVFPIVTDKCDNSTSCPGESTCCKTVIGDWACCPLPQAVCCDDYVHCCPHGTVCNLEEESCDDPSGFSASLPWTEKVSAVTLEVQDEKCDQETMCPGGTTCCKKDSGQWACCPLPQAVCCSDQEHCCPKGYKCNVAAQTCDQPGGRSLPWLQKILALGTELHQAASAPAPRGRNMCDSSTSCPKDMTCCFMDRTHQWGCCPLPKAVCCSDGDHCCPSGHTCEHQRSACSRGSHAVPWFTKLSAVAEPGAVTDVKCDDKSSCATGTTCCKLLTGEWGCCPLVKAVCCADHEHCCPQGYTCNMQTGTCEKKNLDELVQTLPQIKVVRSGPGDAEDVPCDGTGEFHCPRKDTCCKTSSTEWACCPSPRATCCSDSKHCCPEGFSCDVAAGGCTMERPQLTWDLLSGNRQRDFVPHGL
ncbi:granulin b isoform X2 [Hippoglossus hippoglossus]|uniref:granulin b isoform X2 n=1 Tax=Hippoglossus hippoglossus TaxID=8267 RepID=UPI00148B93F6|nr:granulin b isoform X2 [Hippoglossus hippoglossus]